MVFPTTACRTLSAAFWVAWVGSALAAPSPEIADPAMKALGRLQVLPPAAETAPAPQTSAIPEPVSLAVFGTGLLLLLRRRRL